MRWLALAVLGACSFSPGQLRGDGGTSAIDATDGPGSMNEDAALDAMLDGAPPVGFVRSIDLVDAQVIGGPHTDFPMLVSLTAAYLATNANGGDVENDSGHDIYFSSDQAGTQRLAHDVEVYTATTGELVAWVKIPVLETTTVIYLHYGNPAITTSQENATGTWVGYAFVTHMDGANDATGQAAGPLGTNVGNVPAGRFGPASSFNGTDSALTYGSDTEIDNVFDSGATAEAWVYADTYGESSRGRIFEKGDTNGWSLFVDNQNVTGSASFVYGWTSQFGAWSAPSNGLPVAGWHHIVVTYDNTVTSNNPILVLDGVSVAVSEASTPSGNRSDDSGSTLYLGNSAGSTRTFDGNLDEMRISTGARSLGWIQTQYRNQSDPATFYAVSAPL